MGFSVGGRNLNDFSDDELYSFGKKGGFDQLAKVVPDALQGGLSQFRNRFDTINKQRTADDALKAKYDAAAAQAQGVASSFKPLQAEAMPTASSNPVFNQQRQQLVQRFNAQNQQNQDALRRRFASLGGLNSGAAIKTMQNAEEASNQQREEAIQGVNANEANDLRQEQQAAQGRNFQREMSNQENEFKSRVYGADSAAKFAQLDQALEEFKFNREATQKNFDMAKYQSEHTGGLFGGGGFLGLGI